MASAARRSPATTARAIRRIATWFDRLPAREAVQAIGAHLAGLGGSLALVYDVGRVEGRSWVCAWLLSANGLEAAAMVPLPADTAPQVIQAGLRVATREAARAPALRLSRAKGLAKCPPVVAASARDELPSLTEEQTGVARDALSLAADQLLPPPIRIRLAERTYRRLLILPAGDLSTVPFAAVAGRGRPLPRRLRGNRHSRQRRGSLQRGAPRRPKLGPLAPIPGEKHWRRWKAGGR